MIYSLSSVDQPHSSLAILIKIALVDVDFLIDIYPSFITDAVLLHLQTLADSCDEKEYLLSLVDLGRAACFARTRLYKNSDLEHGGLRFSDSLRDELLGIIPLQQYVHSSSISIVILRFSQQ